MALSFPLSYEYFSSLLRINQVDWQLQWNQELSGLGSGQIIGADLTPALWTGTITTVPLKIDVADSIQAKIESLHGVMRTFYIANPKRHFPIYDPTGSKLGASTPSIGQLDATNAYKLAVAGLPANYELQVGDFFAYDFGTGSTLRAFHRVVEDTIADGAGATPLFEVVPYIRPGVLIGTNITLIRPQLKAFIMPDTLAVDQVDELHYSISIEIMQRY